MGSDKKILLYEVAINNILSYIKENSLGKNDKLPTERQLASMFSISRNSVREALQFLQANDVVVMRQGSGIYVNVFDDTMGYLYRSSDSDIDIKERSKILEDIRQTRILIETFCFKQAAKTITPEQIQQLIDFEESEYRSIDYAGLDFEELIVSFQPNTFLLNIYRRINSNWKTYMESLNAQALPPFDRHMDHLKIIQAIKSQNPKAIEKAILDHHRNI